jgi:hypothetical protein
MLTKNDLGWDFKNYQGDQLPGAVIVVGSVQYSHEKVESKKVTLLRTRSEEYERSEDVSENHEGISGVIEYTADYWMQVTNFQQGKKGYALQSVSGGEIQSVELDEEWAERFNAIQGTEAQKAKGICEAHLAEVVLPALRGA